MGWQGYLALWSAVPVGLALLGGGWWWAGSARNRRAARAAGCSVRPEASGPADDLAMGQFKPGRPVIALFLVYAGLVLAAALAWGYPWALLGLGGLWIVAMGFSLPRDIRLLRRPAGPPAAATADPSACAPAPSAERRARLQALTFDVQVLLFGVAAVVAGAVLLR